MPSAPTRIRISAWLIRSLLTTGPIVVSEPCAAMGPSAASSATTISPSLPSVGRSVLAPAAAPGDAEGDAAGEPLGFGDGDGEAEGDGDADAPGLPRADGEPDAPGLDGAVGTGVGDGAGARRPIGSVLISRNPSLVWTTDAWRPLSAKT